MTDKVQKIREEVERLHNEYRNKKGALYFRKALRTVLFIIDSLQEEPKDKCKGCNNVKGCITCVDGSEWAHIEESVSEIDFEQELYKYFGQVKDFTLGMRIAKRFYEIGRNYLMKDAIDTVVKVDAGGYPYVDRTIELYDYDKDIPLAKKGDKVKIVVIKED